MQQQVNSYLIIYLLLTIQKFNDNKIPNVLLEIWLDLKIRWEKSDTRSLNLYK